MLHNQGQNHGHMNPNRGPILQNDPRIIVVNPGPRAQQANPPQVQVPAAANPQPDGNDQGRADIDQARQEA